MDRIRITGRRALVFISLGFTLTLAALIILAQSSSAQTLERVAASGVFKIGYREDAPLFLFKTEAGNAAGYTGRLLPTSRKT